MVFRCKNTLSILDWPTDVCPQLTCRNDVQIQLDYLYMLSHVEKVGEQSPVLEMVVVISCDVARMGMGL